MNTGTITWFKVGEKTPEIDKTNKRFEASKELLLLGGGMPRPTIGVYSTRYSAYIVRNEDVFPTHWAYVNYPVTD